MFNIRVLEHREMGQNIKLDNEESIDMGVLYGNT